MNQRQKGKRQIGVVSRGLMMGLALVVAGGGLLVGTKVGLAEGVPAVTSVAPAVGSPSGGNTVVIKGSNFSGATGVSFGGTSATFAVVSDSQINATAPGGSGTVGVTVSGPGGTSESSGSPVVFYPLDESEGPIANDASGNGNSGVFGPTASFGTAGPAAFGAEKALTLAGSEPGVAASDEGLPMGSSSRTVELWFKTTDSGAQDLVDYGARGGNQAWIMVLDLEDTHSVTFSQFGGAWTFQTPTLSDGSWHELALVYNNPNMTLYVDGVGGTAQAIGSLATAAAGDSGLLIGGSAPADGRPFTGSMARVGIFDTALSDGVLTDQGSGGQLYTYTDPAPEVTSVAPSGGSEAGGNSVSIRGKWFTGATGVDFGGMPANSFVVNNANLITAIAPGASGVSTVGVTVTGPGGTSPNSGSPALYYRLNETTGSTASDATGNGSTGTFGSTVSLGAAGPSVYGGETGITVGGSQPGVTSNDSLLPLNSSSRTVELWFKTTDSGAQDLVDYGSANGNQAWVMILDYADNHSLTFSQYGSSWTFQTPVLSDGNWHDLALVYNDAQGPSLTLYVDGVGGIAQGLGSLGTAAGGSGALMVGGSSSRPFTGSLARVAVFGTALNGPELALQALGGDLYANTFATGGGVTGNVTATITGGLLSITNMGNGSVSAQLPASEATGALPGADFTDATGSGSGWKVMVQATAFHGAQGADITNGFFLDSGSSAAITPIGATNTSLPGGALPSFVNDGTSDILGSTPVKFLSAAEETGMGTYHGVENVVLDLTPSVYAQVYTSTVTFTILTAP